VKREQRVKVKNEEKANTSLPFLLHCEAPGGTKDYSMVFKGFINDECSSAIVTSLL
jgi:hypothetical protein